MDESALPVTIVSNLIEMETNSIFELNIVIQRQKTYEKSPKWQQ